jgi:hypothetical protein
MSNYFSTKNAENIRYEISVLKNTNLLNVELEQISSVESILFYSKTICRVYFAMEIINWIFLLYKRRKGEISMKNSSLVWKIALVYLRVNLIWIFMNYGTNYYINKHTNIRKIISKYKAKNSNIQFKKFIEHRI